MWGASRSQHCVAIGLSAPPAPSVGASFVSGASGFTQSDAMWCTAAPPATTRTPASGSSIGGSGGGGGGGGAGGWMFAVSSIHDL